MLLSELSAGVETAVGLAQRGARVVVGWCGGDADSDFNDYVNKRAPQQTKRLLNMVSQQIFPKAQVFANRNAYDFLHLFWAFTLTGVIHFGVVGQETTFSLIEILQQPIRNYHFKVFKANRVSEIVSIFVCGYLCLWKDVSIQKVYLTKLGVGTILDFFSF